MAGVQHIGGISVDHPGSLLDVRIGADLDVHEVERNLALVAACGFPLPAGADRRLRLRDVRGETAEFRRHIVLHPGGTAPARRWRAGRWRVLGRLLRQRGHDVVVTGSAAERPLTSGITAGEPGVVDRGGTTDLAGLAGIVASARCIVVGNTGPAHIAAAVGTPVVSLFAPTVPALRWRPWLVPHALLGDQDINCAGCREVECPVAGHPCIDSVTPRHVVRSIETLVARAWPQQPLGATA
jgi:ADP-heptose:LPS heptosyltransferase